MNWGWDRVLDLNLKAPFYLTRFMKIPQTSIDGERGGYDEERARSLTAAAPHFSSTLASVSGCSTGPCCRSLSEAPRPTIRRGLS